MTRAPRARAVIVGGGPAGLFAAENLAEAGLAVTLYERMPSVGRKLLMAGRGGLNLTHSEPLERFVTRYGSCRDWIAPMLAALPPAALVAWCEALGQETFVGSSGRVFPKAMKASPLLRAWLARLAALGVKIVPRAEWRGWSGDGALSLAIAGEERLVGADVVILALGGASWPRLGSDGGWVGVLAAAGVPIAPLVASNVGVAIAWSDTLRQRAEGEALKRIAVSHAGRTLRGEAVITATGLEGGAIYGLNASIRSALDTQATTTIAIDLRPDLTVAQLAEKLEPPRQGASLATILRKRAGLSPAAALLLREAGALPLEAQALAASIKAVPLTVTGLGGLERAISTAGGIRREAVDERLMLRARPGVFVAGEMLEWDAPTGGYLLQASFASGRKAAQGALSWLGRAPVSDGAAADGGSRPPEDHPRPPSSGES